MHFVQPLTSSCPDFELFNVHRSSNALKASSSRAKSCCLGIKCVTFPRFSRPATFPASFPATSRPRTAGRCAFSFNRSFAATLHLSTLVCALDRINGALPLYLYRLGLRIGRMTAYNKNNSGESGVRERSPLLTTRSGQAHYARGKGTVQGSLNGIQCFAVRGACCCL